MCTDCDIITELLLCFKTLATVTCFNNTIDFQG